jgi:hypothetical protein
MKTIEILNKYKRIVSKLLDKDPDCVVFVIDNKVIEVDSKSLDYIKPTQHWGLGDFEVRLQNIANPERYELISTFKLYQLPHCCAFMVSCNVHVTEKFRSKGIGTVLNMFRQDVGRALGYTSVLCTDIDSNVHQRKLLATNGWKDIYTVVNKRTKNRVYLSVINI